MMRPTQIAIPTLVRVKQGALSRLGIYLRRGQHARVAVLISQGLVPHLRHGVEASLAEQEIQAETWVKVGDHHLETATQLFVDLPKRISAVVGVGGGKALDVAKYVAFLARLPYYAVPTSLSNDGFCSPQSSLVIRGERHSLPAALPRGVIIDTGVCLGAPRLLTLSGIGDLVAKYTAVRDWKLAYHATGTTVNDFAALISENSIHAFLSHSQLDEDGIRLLATGLLLNGIAMEVAGSSRPASGSEHLISHALDAISARPRLHGLQVGVATYLCSLLQGNESEAIDSLFKTTGLWEAVTADPFSLEEWRAAIRAAPRIKEDFHTILSMPGRLEAAERLLVDEPRLARCFGL